MRESGMKLVAVSRVRNEADIIEAFVRHHCVHFHKLIILDDGSSDGTASLLGSLQAAGLPLVVLKEQAIAYEQSRYMTLLLRMAVDRFGADWVAPLDADEFVEPPPGTTLADCLAPCGPRLMSLSWNNFVWSPDSDESAEPNPVLRLRLRLPPRADRTKLLVPAPLVDDDTELSQGSHFLLRDGNALPSVPLTTVSLCHFPIRDPLQYAGKIAVGYLKYAAIPQWTGELGFHYVDPYRSLLAGGVETLKQRMPADSRRYSRDDPAGDGDGDGGAQDRPCDYRGGPLTLTPSPQPLLSNVLSYTEALARALADGATRLEAATGAAARRELAAAVVQNDALEQRVAELRRELSAVRRQLLSSRVNRLLNRFGPANLSRAIARRMVRLLRLT